MTTNFELGTATAYQPSANLLSTFAPTVRTRPAISTDTVHSAASLGQDTAALSTTLATSAVSEDDSRSAHVAAIGQSIAAGTYSVSSYEVASSIIDSLS